MAFLTEIRADKPPAVIGSPFWAKTYGGYTEKQIDFLCSNLGSVHGKRICDPMSGQAFSTCQMAWAGAKVQLFDINPGALSLASLRDPILLRNASELAREVRAKLQALDRPNYRVFKREHSPKWVSADTLSELRAFAAAFGFTPKISPFSKGSSFWVAPPLARLALGLTCLAARSITCFQSSDNTTWLKQGGITPRLSVSQAVNEALRSWESFSRNAVPLVKCSGSLRIATRNSEFGDRPQDDGKMDAVIVSPPYANRLDYSLLWGPELAVVAALFDDEVSLVKAEQVGTTVVSGKWPSDDEVRCLPIIIQRSLHAIRVDQAKASERYYYPFFANYALSLDKAVGSWCRMVTRGGKLLAIIRDTVRKDHLFPSDAIVREGAKAHGLCHLNPDEAPLIIRHHIGMLRHRRAKSSLHGLAQREWMLAFERS